MSYVKGINKNTGQEVAGKIQYNIWIMNDEPLPIFDYEALKKYNKVELITENEFNKITKNNIQDEAMCNGLY